MLDNIFSGTLLAGLAGIGAVAVFTADTGQPRAAAPTTSAATPMPIYQLPRVVVRGHVVREPALLAVQDADTLPAASPARPQPGITAALR